MTSRMDVVKAALALVDVRWLHQGRNPSVGLDCVGLLVATSETLGIPIYDFCRYTRHPEPKLAIQHARLGMDEIPCTDVGPGAVVCCRNRENGDGQHFCIITDRDTRIHALARYRRVVEVPNDGFWQRMALAAFHFRGVDYEWQP